VNHICHVTPRQCPESPQLARCHNNPFQPTSSLRNLSPQPAAHPSRFHRTVPFAGAWPIYRELTATRAFILRSSTPATPNALPTEVFLLLVASASRITRAMPTSPTSRTNGAPLPHIRSIRPRAPISPTSTPSLYSHRRLRLESCATPGRGLQVIGLLLVLSVYGMRLGRSAWMPLVAMDLACLYPNETWVCNSSASTVLVLGVAHCSWLASRKSRPGTDIKACLLGPRLVVFNVNDRVTPSHHTQDET
jgi:hypothetical protein